MQEEMQTIRLILGEMCYKHTKQEKKDVETFHTKY